MVENKFKQSDETIAHNRRLFILKMLHDSAEHIILMDIEEVKKHFFGKRGFVVGCVNPPMECKMRIEFLGDEDGYSF